MELLAVRRSTVRLPHVLVAVWLLFGQSERALGGETIFAAFQACGGVPTAGAYDDLIDVTLDGWGTIVPDSLGADAFYWVSPNDPSVSLGPNGGQFRFSRADQGGCTCQAECAGNNQALSDAVIGPIPPFDPAHQYQVQVNLGTASPGKINFGAADCGCFDNSGGITVTIASCVTDGDCEDGNPCTFDFCGAGTCTHYLRGADDCDDGDPCTSNDSCLFGVCTGTPACFPGGMRLRPIRPVLLPTHFGGALATGGDRVAVGAGFDGSGQRVEGAVYVYAATGEFLYRLPNPEPLQAPGGGGPNFGSALATDGNLLVVGAPYQDDSAGAAYVVDLTAGALLSTLVNPSPAPSSLGDPDFFGNAVAIGSSKAVVSAVFQEGGGAVYVFDAASGALLYPLARPGNGYPTGFGSSVAVLDDRLLVGDRTAFGPGYGAIHVFELATGAFIESWWNPDSAAGFGSALVVSGTDVLVGTSGVSVNVIDGTTGQVLRKFPNPTPPPQGVDDLFGQSMALADGRVAVGASGAGGGGKVHVFDFASGDLIRTIFDPLPNDPALVGFGQFGSAMASLPSSVLVGAPDDADLRGTVYVVDAQAATIIGGFQQPNAASLFGDAIAARGSEVFVGAPGDYDSHPSEGGKAGGRVYRYVEGVAADAIIDPSRQDGDRFGAAIAADAERVVIGAPGTGGGAGEAFVFNQAPGGYVGLVAPDGADGDGLGTAVAFAGDAVVVGAPYADSGAKDAGSAYVFEGSTGTLLHVLHPPEPSEGAYFGAAVAATGSYALLGAPFDDDGRGRVYLADAPAGVIVASFGNPGAAPRTLFGSSVAWVRDQVLVGAPLEDIVDQGTTVTGAGAAYLFDTATGALLRSFHSPFPRRGAEFGFSVAAIDGDVLVGAPLDESDPTTIDTGTVYRFHATGEFVGEYKSLAPGSREQFGFAISSIGTSVLAGAPGSRSAYILTEPASAASVVGPASRMLASPALPARDGGLACLGGYCFDGNPCTQDLCDVGAGGCVFEPIPGCGRCATDLECTDDAICNGIEHCVTCDGCFLHRWACCGRVAHCAAGRHVADGIPCNDGDRCPSEGTCKDGACVCAHVLTDCSTCHDDDPCTYDLCDPTTGCSFEPVTGHLAVTCAFDRPFPGASCAGQRLPKLIKRGFAKAHEAVVKGFSGPVERRQRRLKMAARILKKTLAAAAKKHDHRRAALSTECSESITNLLRDAEIRVAAALAERS